MITLFFTGRRWGKIRQLTITIVVISRTYSMIYLLLSIVIIIISSNTYIFFVFKSIIYFQVFFNRIQWLNMFIYYIIEVLHFSHTILSLYFYSISFYNMFSWNQVDYKLVFQKSIDCMFQWISDTYLKNHR